MTNALKHSIAETAISFINSTDRHIFLTGKAGTGKTTFLKNISKLTYKNTIVAAPTGIAAINAGGVTLHSLFQLPFGTFIPGDFTLDKSYDFKVNTPHSLIRSHKINKAKRSMLNELELLIIDEVSMLRADLLDAIDVVLRSVRKQKDVSFGGVQVLFIGDLLQLPPVVKDSEGELLSKYYSDIFFFNSIVMKNNPPLYIELEKVYRQSDPVFISLLNRLRESRLNQNDINCLNRYYKPGFEPAGNPDSIFITTHNWHADVINKKQMRENKEQSYFFSAEVDGEFGEHLYPVDEKLELKKGAQVMFIKNDITENKRYFNGKIGSVLNVDHKKITIRFTDETSDTEVERYIWENINYTLNKETNEIYEKVIGTFSHYPLKAAWAVTVHKSQGMTFEKAVIDVSRAFVPGQVYVALSRLTSLAGLVLSEKIPLRLFSQNKNLMQFQRIKKDINVINTELLTDVNKYMIKTVMEAFKFDKLLQKVIYHIVSYDKDEKKSVKQQYKKKAEDLLKDTEPIKKVGVKFIKQLQNIVSDSKSNYLPLLHKRLLAAKGYFEPLLKDISDGIKKQIKDLSGEKGVKAFINELKEVENLYFNQLKLIYKAEAMVAASCRYEVITGDFLKKSGLYDGRADKDYSNCKTSVLTKPEKQIENTKEISFKLFIRGKTLDEIAKERNLSVSTIEGHLTYFVRQGKIDIYKFLNNLQLTEILSCAKNIETDFLKPIKEKLGNKYSYFNLKIAIAYKQFIEENGKI